MPRKMTPSEREAFLAAKHVGIISIDAGDGKPPFAVPVWYAYEPGGLVTVMTPPGSFKVRLLKRAGGYTLSVQEEEPPYRYVTVSGPVVESTDPVDPEEHLAMAQRYLGEEGGREYMVQAASMPEAAEYRPSSIYQPPSEPTDEALSCIVESIVWIAFSPAW